MSDGLFELDLDADHWFVWGEYDEVVGFEWFDFLDLYGVLVDSVEMQGLVLHQLIKLLLRFPWRIDIGGESLYEPVEDADVENKSLDVGVIRHS